MPAVGSLTSSALNLLISEYGFVDVLTAGKVVLDRSRVAAQIASGICFLGAGIIIRVDAVLRAEDEAG